MDSVCPGALLVKPVLHRHGEPVHGLYLMDSFAWVYTYGRGPPWSMSYIRMLVEYFYLRGLVVLVAIMDGARVVSGDYVGMFRGLMHSLDYAAKQDVRFVVVASMGNDLLSSWAPTFLCGHHHVEDVVRGLLRLQTAIRSRCRRARVALVYGGSSSAWGYVTDGQLYDEAVARVMSRAGGRYDVAIAFFGSDFITIDAVGHLSVESYPAAFRLLLRASGVSFASRL